MEEKQKRRLESMALILGCVCILWFAKAAECGETQAASVPEGGGEETAAAVTGQNYMDMDGTGKRVVYQRKGKGSGSFLVEGGCLYLYENLYGDPELLGIDLRTGERKRFPAAW